MTQNNESPDFAKKLFPKLAKSKFKYVNLNEEAKLWLGSKCNARLSPLLDASTCQHFVEEVHKKYQTDYSYGGYLEDRSVLWKGSYLEAESKFIHLGIDINVPSGIELSFPLTTEIVLVDDDGDEVGGWGPRIILRSMEPRHGDIVFILGHLQNINVRANQIIEPGKVLAQVGKAPANGNWFPHLHIQCMLVEEFEKLRQSGLQNLDGYAKRTELERLTQIYPNPAQRL